jgi:predicted nucleotidyltransferase
MISGSIQRQINEIVRRIAQNHDPEKIILFGSFAEGKARQDSDLDLMVIVKDSPLPRYKRSREIRKSLWGITDIPKDILVYTQSEIDEWENVEEAFISEVMRKGKILYEKDQGRVGQTVADQGG